MLVVNRVQWNLTNREEEVVKKGYVGGAFKPCHIGHWHLIEQSANSCDETKLFISNHDRNEVSKDRMKEVWDKYLIPLLPANVIVTFSDSSPVKDIYLALKEADSDTRTYHKIFSDEKDALKYTKQKIQLFAPNLVANNLVANFPVPRTETNGISGTQMRMFMSLGLFDEFVAGLPVVARCHAKGIWDTLLKTP